jgi:hypothetical protein
MLYAHYHLNRQKLPEAEQLAVRKKQDKKNHKLNQKTAVNSSFTMQVKKAIPILISHWW